MLVLLYPNTMRTHFLNAFGMRMVKLSCLTWLVLIASLDCVQAQENSGDWPAWRGDGTGCYKTNSSVTTPTIAETVSWQVEIAGFGYSSPIVKGGRVFLTTAMREDFKRVPWTSVVAMLCGVVAYLLWRKDKMRWRANEILIGHVLFGGYVAAVASFELVQRNPDLSSTFLSGSYSVRMWLLSHFVAAVTLGMGLFFAQRAIAPLGFVSLAVVVMLVWFAVMPPDRSYQDARFGNRWIYWIACLVGPIFGFPKANFQFGAPVLPFSIGAITSVICVYLVVFTEYHVPPGFWMIGGWIAMTLTAGMVFAWSAKQRGDIFSKSSTSFIPAALTILSATLAIWSGNYAPSTAGTRLELVCIDIANGNELWRSGFVSTSLVSPHYANSYATPTPAHDGDRVFAYFGNAGLAAFDSNNGNMLWHQRNAPMNSAYGAGTSPILFEGMVILACDGDSESFVHAFDSATGQPRWRARRKTERGSFGTPCKAKVAGQHSVVIGGGGLLASYQTSTGQEIWSQDFPLSEVVASPVVDGDMLYFASENHMLVYQLSATGAALKWEMFDDAPWIASPLVWQNKLYTLSDAGVLCRLDKITGIVEKRLDLDCSTCFSSPVVCGDTLLCCSKAGCVISVRLPDLTVLNKIDLGQTCVASPAVTSSGTIVRTTGRLSMVGPRRP